MTLKQYLLLTSISLYAIITPSYCMDKQTSAASLSTGEDVLHVLATQCPHALHSIALDILARNPETTWSELLAVYTVNQDNKRLLGKAMLPMIKAIGKEIRTLQRDALQQAMFKVKCVFRQPPKEFGKITESLKNCAQVPQLIIIIDNDLRFNTSLANEALDRSQLWSSKFIASPLKLSQHEVFIGPNLLNDLAYYTSGTPQRTVFHLSWEPAEPHAMYYLLKASEKINQIIKNNHVIIVTTADPTILNHLISKDTTMIINVEKPTLKDRLVTLKYLAIKHKCPAAIIQNLATINQIIPEELTYHNQKIPATFHFLEGIFYDAEEIFLSRGEFDKAAAQHYFARDNLYHWERLPVKR